MRIKEYILKTLNIMWYAVKLYIKSIFAFWGVVFLLAIKAHKNPFVEFQNFSGNEFYATSVNCAFVITVIFLTIKFALWLYDNSEKDSGVVVNVITVRDTSLGVAKEARIKNEKERENGVTKESPENKAKQ